MTEFRSSSNNRDHNLKSMAGLLPNFYNTLQIHNNTEFIDLQWPTVVVDVLQALSKGPDFSHVDSGHLLSFAISDLRNSLSIPSLSPSASHGYALFFDDFMSPRESSRWFRETLPSMACLVLRVPALLDSHYKCADDLSNCGELASETGLRLLPSQQPGVVFLGQELIAALLACSFFCLFPTTERSAKDLPIINFDLLFGCLYENYSEKQENKIKCIIHYFERVCSSMPKGFVSFERKVLPFEPQLSSVTYPEADFWRKSGIPLCPFNVHDSGFIEDQPNEALEVDFANQYLGGGALRRGCVQEEIRFMINPELIAGMLFLPCMEDNEAIEIVGAERFSNYTGCGSSFRFYGDHVDQRSIDGLRRRKTMIVAMDALCNPGERQYRLKFLLREINKAFCGFFDQSNYIHHKRLCQASECQRAGNNHDTEDTNIMSKNCFLLDELPSASIKLNKMPRSIVLSDEKASMYMDHEDKIGIATGNWGCGAFGGDPELKSIIQWLAASQALRPFFSYYSCGVKELQNLNKVTQWILSHKWTVGDLWNVLLEYSSQRLNGKTNMGFFMWLLPSLGSHESKITDMPAML